MTRYSLCEYREYGPDADQEERGEGDPEHGVPQPARTQGRVAATIAEIQRRRPEQGQHDRLGDPAGDDHRGGRPHKHVQDQRHERPDRADPSRPSHARGLGAVGQAVQAHRVGDHPRIAGGGDEQRRVQHGERPGEKDRVRQRAEDRDIHGLQRADHVPSFRVEPDAAQHGGPEQVEGQRRERVDHHGTPGIDVQHANPAAGAIDPRGGAVARAGASGVALFQAPVRVHDQLGRPDADDAEGPEGGAHRVAAGGVGRRQVEAQSVRQLVGWRPPIPASSGGRPR